MSDSGPLYDSYWGLILDQHRLPDRLLHLRAEQLHEDAAQGALRGRAGRRRERLAAVLADHAAAVPAGAGRPGHPRGRPGSTTSSSGPPCCCSSGDKFPVTSSLNNLRGQFFTDNNLRRRRARCIVALPTLIDLLRAAEALRRRPDPGRQQGMTAVRILLRAAGVARPARRRRPAAAAGPALGRATPGPLDDDALAPAGRATCSPACAQPASTSPGRSRCCPARRTAGPAGPGWPGHRAGRDAVPQCWSLRRRRSPCTDAGRRARCVTVRGARPRRPGLELDLRAAARARRAAAGAAHGDEHGATARTRSTCAAAPCCRCRPRRRAARPHRPLVPRALARSGSPFGHGTHAARAAGAAAPGTTRPCCWSPGRAGFGFRHGRGVGGAHRRGAATTCTSPSGCPRVPGRHAGVLGGGELLAPGEVRLAAGRVATRDARGSSSGPADGLDGLGRAAAPAPARPAGAPAHARGRWCSTPGRPSTSTTTSTR